MPLNASAAAMVLRDLSDSGAHPDQWLILGPLSYPLRRLGHVELAAAMRKGFSATPFAATVLPTAINDFGERAEFERESASSTLNMSQGDLVDSVLVILDEIAADGESSKSDQSSG